MPFYWAQKFYREYAWKFFTPKVSPSETCSLYSICPCISKQNIQSCVHTGPGGAQGAMHPLAKYYAHTKVTELMFATYQNVVCYSWLKNPENRMLKCLQMHFSATCLFNKGKWQLLLQNSNKRIKVTGILLE